ncbi:hypothetical protein H7849_11850 [Alloacidobacterium dinghuense]|uniref:Uncharacterized protein n=1 Tax=Alloacidobacterium dinghuense TaxID=2763107 RepID=A0A7G8BPP9_9BACT|nr:hypothetical protein [Alloacidobacterium dinghuense]QNI34519.1 hypothetical protein H7849_11850 [Alloacidobacterium dinghuense]
MSADLCSQPIQNAPDFFLVTARIFSEPFRVGTEAAQEPENLGLFLLQGQPFFDQFDHPHKSAIRKDFPAHRNRADK